MGKLRKNIGFIILAITVLVVGGNLWLDVVGAVPFGASDFTVDLGNTTIRADSNGNIGGQLHTNVSRGARFTRKASAPRRLNGWTWLRGTFTRGTNAQTGGVGLNETIWISTSQLTRSEPTPAQVDRGVVCHVTANNTSVRHDPTLGIGGTAARLTNSRGAVFMPVESGRISNGGFTWVLGTIHGTAAQTRGVPDNGFTRTNFNHGVVWVATSQLTPGAQNVGTGWCT